MIDIIPAIDLIDGKCVRLTQGDFSRKTIYNENPLEIAKQFESVGIKRLHLVDLDGAKKGELVNLKVLEQIASKTSLVIDFGGGIKSDVAIQSVFDAGTAIATIGSVAVKEPEMFYGWIKKYSTDKILLGADVKDEKIVINGWLDNTDISIFDFIKQSSAKGVSSVFCTDVAKDGLLQGTSADLYKKIIANYSKIKLIASGGVSTIKDVEELQSIGCSGVIIGKAIYEGRISMEELKKYNY